MTAAPAVTVKSLQRLVGDQKADISHGNCHNNYRLTFTLFSATPSFRHRRLRNAGYRLIPSNGDLKLLVLLAVSLSVTSTGVLSYNIV